MNDNQRSLTYSASILTTLLGWITEGIVDLNSWSSKNIHSISCGVGMTAHERCCSCRRTSSLNLSSSGQWTLLDSSLPSTMYGSSSICISLCGCRSDLGHWYDRSSDSSVDSSSRVWPWDLHIISRPGIGGWSNRCIVMCIIWRLAIIPLLICSLTITILILLRVGSTESRHSIATCDCKWCTPQISSICVPLIVVGSCSRRGVFIIGVVCCIVCYSIATGAWLLLIWLILSWFTSLIPVYVSKWEVSEEVKSIWDGVIDGVPFVIGVIRWQGIPTINYVCVIHHLSPVAGLVARYVLPIGVKSKWRNSLRVNEHIFIVLSAPTLKIFTRM